MKQIDSVRDAKEYLIGRIVAQADRDGVALSDVERKMLYFSETGWTLPDMMAVSREFDETYDQDEYEGKIGGIVGRIRDQRDGGRDDEDWDRAVERLAGEDHYLLVLIAAGNGVPTKSGRWETARWILAGVVVVGICLPFGFFVDSHVQDAFISEMLVFGMFVGMVVLMAWVANLGR